TRGTPADMADTAEKAAVRGFAAVKIKLGQGLDADRAAMDAIRRAVGDDLPLCADANGAYASGEVGLLLDAASDHGLLFIEDPCPLAPLSEQLAGLRDGPVPIVLDRHCNSALAARQFIELGFNRFAAKPTRVGISEAQAVIDAAAADGGKAVIGLFGESAAGALTQLRLAASAPGGVLLGIEASAHEA